EDQPLLRRRRQRQLEQEHDDVGHQDEQRHQRKPDARVVVANRDQQGASSLTRRAAVTKTSRKSRQRPPITLTGTRAAPIRRSSRCVFTAERSRRSGLRSSRLSWMASTSPCRTGAKW